MIIDNLLNHTKYKSLHPLFNEAFNYLNHLNLDNLVEGKIELLGTHLFAICSTSHSIQPDTKLEAHQAYIDIHYIIEGTELFGWKALSECNKPIDAFNIEKDYILYDNTDYSTIKLTKGSFAIVYPEDAHAPGIETKNLKKIVLKIKI